MAKRTITDCDKCGKKNLVQHGVVIIPYAEKKRACAEHSDSDYAAYLDLCVECLTHLAQTFVTERIAIDSNSTIADTKKGDALLKSLCPAYYEKLSLVDR